jgi:hypothetical protein
MYSGTCFQLCRALHDACYLADPSTSLCVCVCAAPTQAGQLRWFRAFWESGAPLLGDLEATGFGPWVAVQHGAEPASLPAIEGTAPSATAGQAGWSGWLAMLRHVRRHAPLYQRCVNHLSFSRQPDYLPSRPPAPSRVLLQSPGPTCAGRRRGTVTACTAWRESRPDQRGRG